MSEQKPDKRFRDFARYGGLAFQMLLSIGLFTYGGYKMDQRAGQHEVLFTALGGLLGVALALYQVMRALKN